MITLLDKIQSISRCMTFPLYSACSLTPLSLCAQLQFHRALRCLCTGDDRSRDRDRGGFFGRRDGSQDGSQDGQDDGPSRADEADDWGASRKFVPSDKTSSFGGGGGFRDRRDEGREGAEGEDAGVCYIKYRFTDLKTIRMKCMSIIQLG